MAKVIAQEKTWFLDSSDLDMRALDVTALRNGQIAVAFGGANQPGSGVIYTGLVNMVAGTLGSLTTTLYPGNASGGQPFTTVRSIELEKGVGNNMVLTAHLANSAVGSDGNFALLTQVYDGVIPTGTPHAVNPLTPQDNTNEVYDTITKANGSYFTFSNTLGGGLNLSDGIVMTAFRADGTVAAAPKVIVADHAVSFFEANPETPSATLMANGHIGLIYKDSNVAGSPEVLFQEFTQAGAAVAGPVLLQGSAALAGQIVTLTGGQLVATWTSVDITAKSTLMGQLIDATGHLSGTAFEISAAHVGSESRPDVVALANGGFAVSWVAGGTPLARIFDATGKATGNDFAITETAAAFDALGSYGLTVNGSKLIGFASGSSAGQHSSLLGEVFGTGSTRGETWDGTGIANGHTGTAQDDRLNGLAGSDTLAGLAGNDILSGGSGVDKINGGDGRDVIRGGTGRDVLTGGGGGDVFLFDLPTDGRDKITDFHQAEGDRIAVDHMGFGRDLIPGGGYFLPFTYPAVTLSTTTNAAVAGLQFNTATHILSFDADGAGTAYARNELAYLPGVSTLAASDFAVI